MFLKIDGIAGEAKDDKHADEIDILAWSWGMTQSGTMASIGGGGAGKVSVQDMSFTKWIDKASPNLMLACCNGKHLPNSLLTVRKAGEKPLEYLKITMTDCILSSVSNGGSDGEERLTENITLNFAKVKMEYQAQKKDGSPDGGAVTTGWNIETNAPF
jgi:type VI secretion system secreted protein Hcp